MPANRTVLPDHALVGMVHVRALPGTPYSDSSIESIASVAAEEAVALARAGFEAVCVENMHDRPYLLRGAGPEITAAMTAVALAVRSAVDCPVGVQVLAGANDVALAVALAAGAQFVRAEGFVFAHVADEGLMSRADAGDLLRLRRTWDATHIAVFADVKKKHSSHAITSDVDLADTARAAEFFGADGIVVTGNATGMAAAVEDVQSAAAAVDVPVLIGSGITPDNLAAYWDSASAFIIGSSIKRDGRWDQPLDEDRMKRMIAAAHQLRNQ